jgi:DNA-directed RNA polymerase specialized sigma24 family protein
MKYDLTTHDVALLCDVRVDTVRKWLYQGKIKYKKSSKIIEMKFQL